MYVSVKMRPVETMPRMGEGEVKKTMEEVN
jgi:hypothetical protein